MQPSQRVRLRFLLCLAASVMTVNADVAQAKASRSNLTGGEDWMTGIPVLTFKWHHVKGPCLVVLWILVVGVCKLGMSCYHGDSPAVL